MNVFVIDAYDSFVFIIDQYLQQLGLQTRVERNDTSQLIEQIDRYQPDFIVLGPGPGHPAQAGYVEIIQQFQGRIPLLGVCLGHQAIGLAYGAKVERAGTIMHGKASTIDNDGQGLFAHTQAQSIQATRYHSLLISDDALPQCLQVSARAQDDHAIMGIRHRSLPIESVQFHPESILTEQGIQLFANFIERYCVAEGG